MFPLLHAVSCSFLFIRAYIFKSVHIFIHLYVIYFLNEFAVNFSAHTLL